MLKSTHSPKPLNVSGPQIRFLRNERGWSQLALAAKCQIVGWDVTRDTIANIELKRRWVADHELIVLAAVLKVEVKELLPKRSKAVSR